MKSLIKTDRYEFKKISGPENDSDTILICCSITMHEKLETSVHDLLTRISKVNKDDKSKLIIRFYFDETLEATEIFKKVKEHSDAHAYNAQFVRYRFDELIDPDTKQHYDGLDRLVCFFPMFDRDDQYRLIHVHDIRANRYQTSYMLDTCLKKVLDNDEYDVVFLHPIGYGAIYDNLFYSDILKGTAHGSLYAKETVKSNLDDIYAWMRRQLSPKGNMSDLLEIRLHVSNNTGLWKFHLLGRRLDELFINHFLIEHFQQQHNEFGVIYLTDDLSKYLNDIVMNNDIDVTAEILEETLDVKIDLSSELFSTIQQAKLKIGYFNWKKSETAYNVYLETLPKFKKSVFKMHESKRLKTPSPDWIQNLMMHETGQASYHMDTSMNLAVFKKSTEHTTIEPLKSADHMIQLLACTDQSCLFSPPLQCEPVTTGAIGLLANTEVVKRSIEFAEKYEAILETISLPTRCDRIDLVNSVSLQSNFRHRDRCQFLQDSNAECSQLIYDYSPQDDRYVFGSFLSSRIKDKTLDIDELRQAFITLVQHIAQIESAIWKDDQETTEDKEKQTDDDEDKPTEDEDKQSSDDEDKQSSDDEDKQSSDDEEAEPTAKTPKPTAKPPKPTAKTPKPPKKNLSYRPSRLLKEELIYDTRYKEFIVLVWMLSTDVDYIEFGDLIETLQMTNFLKSKYVYWCSIWRDIQSSPHLNHLDISSWECDGQINLRLLDTQLRSAPPTFDVRKLKLDHFQNQKLIGDILDRLEQYNRPLRPPAIKTRYAKTYMLYSDLAVRIERPCLSNINLMESLFLSLTKSRSTKSRAAKLSKLCLPENTKFGPKITPNVIRMVPAYNHIIQLRILAKKLSEFTPSIPKIYNYAVDAKEGTSYIVMEPLMNISTFITDDLKLQYFYFSIRRFLDLATQIGNFVHGDLRLMNLMARPNSNIDVHELEDGRYLYTKFDFTLVVTEFRFSNFQLGDLTIMPTWTLKSDKLTDLEILYNDLIREKKKHRFTFPITNPNFDQLINWHLNFLHADDVDKIISLESLESRLNQKRVIIHHKLFSGPKYKLWKYVKPTVTSICQNIYNHFKSSVL